MIPSLSKGNPIRVRLEVIRVYTLTGIKNIYKLGDMAYGEWLIFKDKKPYYYFNIFDKEYEHFNNTIKTNVEEYLKTKFKKQGGNLSFGPNILGLQSSKIHDEWFDLETLPVALLE
jgi:hypothetical protein